MILNVWTLLIFFLSRTHTRLVVLELMEEVIELVRAKVLGLLHEHARQLFTCQLNDTLLLCIIWCAVSLELLICNLNVTTQSTYTIFHILRAYQQLFAQHELVGVDITHSD